MEDRREISRAYEDQAYEVARLGMYVPNNPMLEARSGGASFAGARQIARNTLRSTWEVLSLVLRNDSNEGY
jgi:hypothetical protein